MCQAIVILRKAFRPALLTAALPVEEVCYRVGQILSQYFGALFVEVVAFEKGIDRVDADIC